MAATSLSEKTNCPIQAEPVHKVYLQRRRAAVEKALAEA